MALSIQNSKAEKLAREVAAQAVKPSRRQSHVHWRSGLNACVVAALPPILPQRS